MEGILEAYKASLRPYNGTPAAADAETRRRRNKIEHLAAAPEGCASHAGVLEMEGAGAVVLRAAVGAAGSSAEDLADGIAATYREVFAADDEQSEGSVAAVPSGGGSGAETASGLQNADGVEISRSKDFNSLNQEIAPLGADIIDQMQRRNNEVNCYLAILYFIILTYSMFCLQLQAFLVDNLMVHLGEMLVIIARERPEDPLKFAYEFLGQRGRQAEQHARERARELFDSSIAEARALEALVEHDLKLAMAAAAAES